MEGLLLHKRSNVRQYSKYCITVYSFLWALLEMQELLRSKLQTPLVLLWLTQWKLWLKKIIIRTSNLKNCCQFWRASSFWQSVTYTNLLDLSDGNIESTTFLQGKRTYQVVVWDAFISFGFHLVRVHHIELRGKNKVGIFQDAQ